MYFYTILCIDVYIRCHLICNAKCIKYLSHFIYNIYLKKTIYLLLFQSELEFLKIKYTADYMPSVSSFLKEKLRPP